MNTIIRITIQHRKSSVEASKREQGRKEGVHNIIEILGLHEMLSWRLRAINAINTNN